MSSKYNCDSQMFPMNDVKLISSYSGQLSSSETPPRGGWRDKTFCILEQFELNWSCDPLFFPYLIFPS